MVLHAPLTVHSHLPGDERLVLTMATALSPATTDLLLVPAPCLVSHVLCRLTCVDLCSA